MKVPDYAEPIIGWRIWHVAERDSALRLLSPLYRSTWQPRLEFRADCRRGLEAGHSLYPRKRPRHAPPHTTCGCGAYGSRTPSDAAVYLTKFFKSGDDVLHRVIGTVSLWGTVIECERGWRASHAYPSHVYVPVPTRGGRRFLARALRRPALPPEQIARALTAYGVPVDLLGCSTLDGLAEALEALPSMLAEVA